jgi:hypothetical protein
MLTKGAIKGWASTISNNLTNLEQQERILRNLFIVGHWSTVESGQGGVAMASALGHRVSKLIIREIKKQ